MERKCLETFARPLIMPEDQPVMSEEELDRLTETAIAIYNERLKGILAPEQNGRTVAVHLDAGDYELAGNSSLARNALRSRHPEGMIATLLVGPDQMDQLAIRMLATREYGIRKGL